MKELLKTCQIFRRSDLLFAFGVLRTPYGGFTVPPASILPVSVLAAELGQTVLKILNGLPGQLTEVNLATARQPYLAYLKQQGFKSLAAFEKGASLVAVHFDGESYEIERYYQDEKRAFLPQSSMKLALGSSGEAVGRAVLTSFDPIRWTGEVSAT